MTNTSMYRILRRQSGFSLIDLSWLIVVVAIVTFLATGTGADYSIETIFWGLLSALIVVVLLAGVLGRIRRKQRDQ